MEDQLTRTVIAFLALSVPLCLCGSIAPNGQQNGTPDIVRDGYGVPHVFATSERALYYGNGYAVAQDRLAQMEKYRRTARGEMAELVGPGALAADRETRTNGYSEAEREAQFTRLDPHLQMV